MRIHVVCHYFLPEIGAPQARLSEMAKTWAEQGHDVRVFTGFPNHPTGVIPPEYRGRCFQEEERDGYRIYRHWLYATRNRGLVKKTLGHVSLMTSLVATSLFRGPRPDVIVVSSPTFFSVISAWAMSRCRRAPYVFEVRDLWPGIFVELGVLQNRFAIRALEALELALYKRARWVVPVTQGFKANIVSRGIPPEKVEVVTNGADLAFFADAEPASRAELGIPADAFLAAYVGAHGISQNLGTVVEAAKRLQDRAWFLFVGEGAEKEQLLKQAHDLGLENVVFLPGQPRARVPGLYAMADVCLVPLRDIEGFRTFIPSKIFEILAVARPIVAGLRGEPAEILERSGAARVVAPDSVDELVLALAELAAMTPAERTELGDRGRRFVAAEYDRRKLALRYLELLGRKP